MKMYSYVAPEAELFGIDSSDFLMVNPSGGNIENPGDGGEDWEW